MTLRTERSYRWLFWTIALAGFALDQASKYTIFHVLHNSTQESKVQLLSGTFELSTQYVRTVGADTLPYVNTGALFGMGRDANLLFAVVSVVAAVAILAWSLRPAVRHDRFLALALGLILAGTLGNLYDRVVFGGVRDFLHWYYLVDWPVFNLADCCLVCGAFLLLVQAFGPHQDTEKMLEFRPAVASVQEVAEAKS
jgi:lipoprotein signal peptidase